MLSTELASIELASELYNLFAADYEDVITALEEALYRRAADEFTDDRWEVTAEEIRELIGRGYEPLDKEDWIPEDEDYDDLDPELDTPELDSLSQERVENSVILANQEEVIAHVRQA